MANKDAAFGLKPIGKVGQNKDNQGLSEYNVSDSATAIYFQDPLTIDATGTVKVAAAGNALIGSLNGIFYTDANTSKPTWANNLKASNTATDIVAFVADDPYERFEIQCDSTANVNDIFQQGDIVYAAGDSANYVSKVEIQKASFTSATAQLKIVGISKDPDNNDTANANVNLVCTINEHVLKQTTGI
jgi:hypothetical protein